MFSHNALHGTIDFRFVSVRWLRSEGRFDEFINDLTQPWQRLSDSVLLNKTRGTLAVEDLANRMVGRHYCGCDHIKGRSRVARK